jgi:hypothetical protein
MGHEVMRVLILCSAWCQCPRTQRAGDVGAGEGPRVEARGAGGRGAPRPDPLPRRPHGGPQALPEQRDPLQTER